MKQNLNEDMTTFMSAFTRPLLVSLLVLTPIAQGTVNDTPYPAEMFQTYCYGTEANYDLALNLAGAMELEPLPEKYAKAVAPPGAVGKAFIIELNKESQQSVMVAVNQNDACSIFYQGYGSSEVLDFIREEYQLESIFTDDVGLEIKEVLVPRPAEKYEMGVVTFSYPKNGPGGIVSYLSPSTAQQMFGN